MQRGKARRALRLTILKIALDSDCVAAVEKEPLLQTLPKHIAAGPSGIAIEKCAILCGIAMAAPQAIPIYELAADRVGNLRLKCCGLGVFLGRDCEDGFANVLGVGVRQFMSLNGRNDLIKARMVGCFTRLWRQSPAVCGCMARRPSGGLVLSFFGAGQ